MKRARKLEQKIIFVYSTIKGESIIKILNWFFFSKQIRILVYQAKVSAHRKLKLIVADGIYLLFSPLEI